MGGFSLLTRKSNKICIGSTLKTTGLKSTLNRKYEIESEERRFVLHQQQRADKAFNHLVGRGRCQIEIAVASGELSISPAKAK